MKKIVTAIALVGMSALASAGEVSLSVANDNKVDRVGSRVTIAADKPLVGSIMPFVSGTFNERYARLAAGGEVGLFNVGAFKVNANLAVVRQASQEGRDGNGFTAGVKATYALTKNVSLVVGAERFNGSDHLDRLTGTVATVGVATRF